MILPHQNVWLYHIISPYCHSSLYNNIRTRLFTIVAVVGPYSVLCIVGWFSNSGVLLPGHPTSFRLTPTIILFGYTRSIPTDLGNVGQTNVPNIWNGVGGIRTTGPLDRETYAPTHSATAPHQQHITSYMDPPHNFNEQYYTQPWTDMTKLCEVLGTKYGKKNRTYN